MFFQRSDQQTEQRLQFLKVSRLVALTDFTAAIDVLRHVDTDDIELTGRQGDEVAEHTPLA